MDCQASSLCPRRQIGNRSTDPTTNMTLPFHLPCSGIPLSAFRWGKAPGHSSTPRVTHQCPPLEFSVSLEDMFLCAPDLEKDSKTNHLGSWTSFGDGSCTFFAELCPLHTYIARSMYSTGYGDITSTRPREIITNHFA